MARYRKKPVEIDAIRYADPQDWEACEDFLGGDMLDHCDHCGDDTIVIRTLEGPMHCPVGHWIIRGVRGEHYSCEDSIFRLTYEPVDQ